eukprot:1551166-Amphidinium_carterae.2
MYTDREALLRAVTKQGLALEHASEGLRGDRELVLIAVSNNWRAIWYAAPALTHDGTCSCSPGHPKIILCTAGYLGANVINI